MKINSTDPDSYIEQIADDKKNAIMKLRKVIKANLPPGFEETMNYGMIGYVVPHSLFPDGYHCDPKMPLPFANIAAQKNFIAIYHMGLYGDSNILEWFVAEHAKRCKKKLDMGKSCIRYKKEEDIPFDLIAELFSKISLEKYIEKYTFNLNKHKAAKP